MKHLLTILIKRSDRPPWWEMRSSEGEPANERIGMYVLNILLKIMSRKLQQVKDKHETTEKTHRP